MELPVRILVEPPAEPVILVDGLCDAPGLNLSHWPGQRTPAHLRHDLSTGSALLFARLPRKEREALAQGCVAIANTHYDTDGTCALFAVRFPALALPRAERLLACARAGDFFELPDLDAFRVDLIVSGLGGEGSPLLSELAGLDDHARWQRMTEHLLQRLPALLDGDLDPYRALFEEEVAHLEADLSELARAARTEDRALDLAVFAGGASFGPGRHAFHGRSERDRVLVLGEARDVGRAEPELGRRALRALRAPRRGARGVGALQRVEARDQGVEAEVRRALRAPA